MYAIFTQKLKFASCLLSSRRQTCVSQELSPHFFCRFLIFSPSGSFLLVAASDKYIASFLIEILLDLNITLCSRFWDSVMTILNAVRIVMLIAILANETPATNQKSKMTKYWSPKVKFVRSMENFTCNAYTYYVFMKCNSTEHLRNSFFNKFFNHVNESKNWEYIKNISQEYAGIPIKGPLEKRLHKWKTGLKQLVKMYIFQTNPKLRSSIKVGYPENVLRDFKTFEHSYFDCIRTHGTLLINYFDIFLISYVTVVSDLYNASIRTKDTKDILKTELKLKEELSSKLREYMQYLSDSTPKNTGPRCNHIKVIVQKESKNHTWKTTEKWPNDHIALGYLLRSKLYQTFLDKAGFHRTLNSTENGIKYRSWVENLVTFEKSNILHFECSTNIDPYHCNQDAIQRLFPSWLHDREECFKNDRELSKKFRERLARLKLIYQLLLKI